jgi:uncharacterized protein YjbJ (UPF0337 family)
MNKDQVQGKGKDLAGRIERQAGEWTGDKEKQVHGALKQVEGKLQNAWGNAKANAKAANAKAANAKAANAKAANAKAAEKKAADQQTDTKNDPVDDATETAEIEISPSRKAS